MHSSHPRQSQRIRSPDSKNQGNCLVNKRVGRLWHPLPYTRCRSLPPNSIAVAVLTATRTLDAVEKEKLELSSAHEQDHQAHNADHAALAVETKKHAEDHVLVCYPAPPPSP